MGYIYLLSVKTVERLRLLVQIYLRVLHFMRMSSLVGFRN
jgi:hypothetical protein